MYKVRPSRIGEGVRERVGVDGRGTSRGVAILLKFVVRMFSLLRAGVYDLRWSKRLCSEPLFGNCYCGERIAESKGFVKGQERKRLFEKSGTWIRGVNEMNAF
jgi:hypothetical protein